jgi:hypothetical protein
MGTHMKTTVEIADPLFAEAKAEARRRGTTVRALIEDGLRRVIAEPSPATYVLPDCSYGVGGPTDEWLRASWEEKLAAIYEGRT